jgi:hypothetical protein
MKINNLFYQYRNLVEYVSLIVGVVTGKGCIA